jgi:hypothetical protein
VVSKMSVLLVLVMFYYLDDFKKRITYKKEKIEGLHRCPCNSAPLAPYHDLGADLVR